MTAALGDSHEQGSGVGHGRTARFADEPHALPFGQRAQVLAEAALVGMLAHLVELAVVNGKLAVHAAQETTGRANVLDHEMANLAHHLGIPLG